LKRWHQNLFEILFYKLFWFRANVQEPVTEFQFFSGNDKINPDKMKGLWYDDESDQLYVDICYFPLVGRSLNSPDRKICTQARVFPRDIQHSSETSEEN
jgi:hypothetical protein